MNPELQTKFEIQMVENNIIKDRSLFNKKKDSEYKHDEVFFMYRVWISQEVRIEKLTNEYERKVKESFLCGYTEAEYDMYKRRKL